MPSFSLLPESLLPNEEVDVVLTEALICDRRKIECDLKGPEEECQAFVMLVLGDRTNITVTS